MRWEAFFIRRPEEIDRALLARARYAWNQDEVKYYETHPSRGLHLLSDINELSEEVREVVKQHHENCLSRGFPVGVKKSAIHPMAKLISVADEFSLSHHQGPGLSQSELS